MDDLERFHTKWMGAGNGCKIWQGKPDSQGYGSFRISAIRGGKLYRAHRWIFIHMNGYAPEAVMHRCDTRLCVNWEGCLIPGTRPANSADMVAKERQCRGEDRPQAKLTENDVREIRRLYSLRKFNQVELAVRYGVHRVTISDALSRRTWGHLG